MTRVDAVISQFLELTESEQQEFFARIDRDSHDDPEEVDRAIMEEIYRRADEMKSGAVKGVPAEEVMNRLRAAVDSARRMA